MSQNSSVVYQEFSQRWKERITAQESFMDKIVAGVEFKDKYFPPDPSSLISCIKSKRPNDEVLFISALEWRRPIELFESNYALFGDIGPSQIRQGMLGDCYFLSAVSAMAEFPDRIRNIFITQEINAAGCYALNVYASGHLLTLVLDDYPIKKALFYKICRKRTLGFTLRKGLGQTKWKL